MAQTTNGGLAARTAQAGLFISSVSRNYCQYTDPCLECEGETPAILGRDFPLICRGTSLYQPLAHRPHCRLDARRDAEFRK
jgi:hypothetical protein